MNEVGKRRRDRLSESKIKDRNTVCGERVKKEIEVEVIQRNGKWLDG